MWKFKIVPLLAAVVLLSGCTINLFGPSQDDSQNGGVFKSSDFGKTWQQKGLLLQTNGQPKAIYSLDALSLALDPTDYKAVYFGSLNNGLFYSYDAGESWQKAAGTGPLDVRNIGVDQTDHCRLYFISYYRLFRSDDCGRNWRQVFADTDHNLLTFGLAIDQHNSDILYMTDSRGDVIKSQDKGVSWRAMLNVPRVKFKKIVLSPFDSRIIFVIGDGSQIYRSTDGGQNWSDLQPKFKAFKLPGSFKDIVFSPKDKGWLVAATSKGLYRTVNNGDDWTALKLITPDKQYAINAVAVSPVDSRKIYYLTDNNFYSTFDGGNTWISSKLPTTRRGFILLADPKNDGTLYLATKRQANDSGGF